MNSFIDDDTYKTACEIDKPLADQLKQTMDNKELMHQELLFYFLEEVLRRTFADI